MRSDWRVRLAGFRRAATLAAVAMAVGLGPNPARAQLSYLVTSFETEADLFTPMANPPPAGTPAVALSSQFGVTQGTNSMQVTPSGFNSAWLTKGFGPETYAEWYDYQGLAFDFTRVTTSAGNYQLVASINGPQGWNEKQLVEWGWQEAGQQRTTTLTWDYGAIRAAAPAPGSGEQADFFQLSFTAQTAPAFAPQNGYIDNIRFINPVAPVNFTWAGNGSTPGGTGFWSTLFEDATWINAGGQAGQWNTYARALFDTAGGTVTVSGPIEARNGLVFNAPGYSVVADPSTDYTSDLMLAGALPEANSIEVGSGLSATIAVPLRGSNGLTKSGAGTLVLPGGNSISGDAVVASGTLRLEAGDALAQTRLAVAAGGTLEVPAGVVPEARSLRLAGGTISAPVINVTTGLDTRSFTVNDFATEGQLYAENPSSGMRNIVVATLADQPAMQASMVQGSEYAWSFKDYGQETLDAWRQHTAIAVDITMTNNGTTAPQGVGNMAMAIDGVWRQTGAGDTPRIVNYVTVPAGQTRTNTYVWDYTDLLDVMPQTGAGMQISMSMALAAAGDQTWSFQNLRFIRPLVPLAAGIGSLTVESGTIAGTPDVRVLNGGVLRLPANSRYLMNVASLEVDTSANQPAGPGLVDLGSGQISIAAGGISAEALRTGIIAGRSGGNWAGTSGLTSTVAAGSGGTRAVGYVVAGDGSARVSFAAPGDTDLNGQVNVFDLVSIDASGTYGSGAPAVWSQGDFNYDGVTNVFDLVGIDTAGAYGAGGYFPAPTPTAGALSSVAAVPEPGSLALWVAAAGLAFAAGRRRPRRRPWRAS